MLSNHLDRFLRDEGGGYTVWGLTWFVLYVGIGGLSVDITNAFRNQSMLQATADAAALAGIASALTNENEVDNWALAYAELNMQQGVHGDVLKAAEVDIGTWNFTTRTFSVGGADPNAVRARTRRDANNANPVATNFLRIIGLDTWNVTAEGIAATGIDSCLNNGIISGGSLSVTPHTHFYAPICLIGEEQFLFRQNDTFFDPGVYIGAGCGDSDKKCIGPGNQVYGHDDFELAFGLNDDGSGGNFNDPTKPDDALNVGMYIAAALRMGTDVFTSFEDFESTLEAEDGHEFVDFSGFQYLFNGDTQPGYETGAALPAEPVPYTIYNLSTCPSSGYVLPQGSFEHIAIIADCPISFSQNGDYSFQNSLIASTYSSQGRAAISGSANVNLGTAGCGDGNEMYSLGDVDFASNGDFANLRILADGDVHFAAQSDSEVGTNIQATGDVQISSGSQANGETDETGAGSSYGLCPSAGNGPKALAIALVQ